MANVLEAYKPLARIQAPATIDGGDVLRVERRIYVGLSSRTNPEAIAQLATLLAQWDYEVIPVPFHGCLHLKSAVTQVGSRQLLMNDRYVQPASFRDMDILTVAPAEPDAANALLVAGGGAVIYPAHYPTTGERLVRAGVRVIPVPAAEIAKAEGGVTCCSILFEHGIKS